jgi:hypothetical protein
MTWYTLIDGTGRKVAIEVRTRSWGSLAITHFQTKPIGRVGLTTAREVDRTVRLVKVVDRKATDFPPGTLTVAMVMHEKLAEAAGATPDE